MSRFLSADDLKPAQPSFDEIPAQIVFIGSKINFPDCLLRMVITEIAGASVSRLAAPVELPVTPIGEQHITLAILEESFTESLGPAQIAQLALDHHLRPILSYRDAAKVEPLLRYNISHPGQTLISLLPMDLNIESWLTVLRLLMTGCDYVPPEVYAAMYHTEAANEAEPHVNGRVHAPEATGALSKLTTREVEVLSLVAEGLQNKQIAANLHLSEHTVKLHLHHVISKLGARNRTEAALRYRESV